MKLRLTIWLLTALFCVQLQAQKIAVKSNLLYDATATINAGVEIGLAPKWTLDLSGNFNGWDITENRKWKHWAVQPEARYWFCERFAGHFLGVHAHGGQYNIGGVDLGLNLFGTDFRKLKDTRYQGWFAGGGVAYGYAWILGKHWNAEAEIGIGYSYTRYDRYKCGHCGEKVEEDQPHHYLGVTKAAINLVYVF